MSVKRKPAPATAEHAPLQLEHFLPYRLSILSNTISEAIADDYQQRHDLSMTEWRVMAVLARSRACPRARWPNARRWTRWP